MKTQVRPSLRTEATKALQYLELDAEGQAVGLFARRLRPHAKHNRLVYYVRIYGSNPFKLVGEFQIEGLAGINHLRRSVVQTTWGSAPAMDEAPSIFLRRLVDEGRLEV